MSTIPPFLFYEYHVTKRLFWTHAKITKVFNNNSTMSECQMAPNEGMGQGCPKLRLTILCHILKGFVYWAPLGNCKGQSVRKTRSYVLRFLTFMFCLKQCGSTISQTTYERATGGCRGGSRHVEGYWGYWGPLT